MKGTTSSRLFKQLTQTTKYCSNCSTLLYSTRPPARTFMTSSLRSLSQGPSYQPSACHVPCVPLRNARLQSSTTPVYSRTISTSSAFLEDGTTTSATSSPSQSVAQPNLRPQGNPSDIPAPQPNERGEVPAYELTFTCKPCKTRSSHRISKHGYHNGTVLITCPECKNRHVISDHLKIFNDARKSFEDILREKGELLKHGTLDPDGDIELWDDGTQSSRKTENSKE